MGVRLLAFAACALVLAAPLRAAGERRARPVQDAVRYLLARQQADGGFAEPGARSSPGLTAWVVLGLRAAGVSPRELRRRGATPQEYLARHGDELESVTDLELRLLALAALGEDTGRLVARLRSHQRRSGAIGPALNSTAWGVLALRQAGARVSRRTVRYLLRHQARSGGWSWHPRGAPDADDTAATIQALRAAGVSGRPIRRALAFLRRHRGGDGGFGLTRGGRSNSQSTAWAIQAFVASGRPPGRASFRYLARMRRPNGSYRYAAGHAITPVWVTAQVLPALARRPFPLR